MASNTAPTRGDVLTNHRQIAGINQGGKAGLVAALAAQRERMGLSMTDPSRPRGHGPIKDDPIPYIKEPQFLPGQPVTVFKPDAKDKTPARENVTAQFFGDPQGPRPTTPEEIAAHNLGVARRNEEEHAARLKRFYAHG